MNFTFFITIAILFYSASCDRVIINKDNAAINSILQKMSADTFVLDIPMVIGGNDFIPEYSRAKESARDLKLKQLINGTDSIELRVWFNYGNEQQCLRVFNDKNEWNGELITVHYTPPKDEQSNWGVSSSVEKKEPKNGWNNYLKKSVELGILTLPDCDKVPGYSFSTGFSKTVAFEIATANLYRFYSYVSPIYFRKTIKEADNVEELFELMQLEFGFKMIETI